MTNIRDVLAANIKKYRHDRGWSQAVLAEKSGTSTKYIGLLETRAKFPSSEMIHKLASALGIDPTELFYKEIKPSTALIHAKKCAFEDVGDALKKYLSAYIAENIKDLNEKIEG
jgi:transcriptional regulator with XRE-family HTH domain